MAKRDQQGGKGSTKTGSYIKNTGQSTKIGSSSQRETDEKKCC